MSVLQHPYPVPAEGSQAVNFNLVDVTGMLWKSKWWILGFTFLGLGIALGIAFLLPKTFVAQGEVVVRAEAVVAPDADRAFNATAVNDAVVATERSVLAAEGLLSRVSQQVAFPADALKPGWLSVQVNRLRERLHVSSPSPARAEEASAEEAAKRLALLKSAVGSGVEKGSSVIAVTASTTDPAFSAAVVNNLLDNYMQDRVEAQQAVARNVEVALQERLRQTSGQIRDTQGRIATLMQQPGLIEGTEIPEAQRNLTILSSQLSQARQNLAERQAAYDAIIRLRNDAHGDPARLAELLDNGSQSTAELRNRFVMKEQDLASLSIQFGPRFPARAAAQGEMDVLARRLNGEAARVVAQRQADLDSANQVVTGLTAQYNNARFGTSQESGSILQLSRERDSLANLRRISGTIEDRLIAVTSQPVDPNARILTRAIAPRLASFPNKPLLAIMGLTVGMVGSSALILVFAFVRRLRPSVITQAEMLAGPLLGSIPKFSRIRGRGVGLLDGLRQALPGGLDRADTAFQGVALELDHALIRKDARVITITSALPQEGKSTVAVALGLKLAKMDRRVLLINCDLHAGRAYYLSERRAFSTSSEVSPEVVIDPSSKLSILELAPTDHPIDFLHSRGFRDLLEAARRQYDIVLCDTPPVLSVPDPLLVTRLSDAVILVSELNRKAGTAEIAELSRRIIATAKPICGVIVTKVDEENAGYAAYLGYRPAARNRRLAVGVYR